MLQCPSDVTSNLSGVGGTTNYLANKGSGIIWQDPTGPNVGFPEQTGIFYYNSRVKMSDILDGSSNTAAFSERVLADGNNGVSSPLEDVFFNPAAPTTPDQAVQMCDALDITNLAFQFPLFMGAPWMHGRPDAAGHHARFANGPGEGWFGPADARYSWEWLAARYGVDEGDGIPADKFVGPKHWLALLDRNQDGRISADDLDWSDRNPWVQQAYLVNRLFRRVETTGDGKLTREEWIAFFDNAARGKDHLLSEDLRDAMLGATAGAFHPGDAPSQAMLIRGLFNGEVGSLNEGPKLDTQAPDFTLATHDGSRKIRLADLVGKKPVVITFGNFTCGPFRSMYPGVEEVYRKFGEEAEFIAVYVREAHPTDGWKMESNNRVGVSVAQPKTFAERAAVATQCHRLLKPSFPLLVDEINDPVGNAYSGMPARLYVIDREGKVAYKSGRGPFGFKSGEMAQALVMTLLDQTSRPGL